MVRRVYYDYIVLEGYDNTGKTTMANFLYKHGKVKDVMHFPNIYDGGMPEPGRSIILAGDLYQGTIKASTSERPIVIDRWWPSNYAYARANGVDRDEWMELIAPIYKKSLEWILPARILLVYLDATPDVLAERGSIDDEHFERVHEAYMEFMHVIATDIRERGGEIDIMRLDVGRPFPDLVCMLNRRLYSPPTF